MEKVKQLFYITHIDNVDSILRHGIMSHKMIEESKIPFTRIYDAQIVSSRQNRKTPDDKSLWEYANVYLQARNPMLYRVLCEKNAAEIAVIGIDRSIMTTPGTFFSAGNAASSLSEIVPIKDSGKVYKEIKNCLESQWWKDEDGSKRKIMAECLIPSHISPEYLRTIYVSNDTNAEKIKKIAVGYKVHIIPEPQLFFESSVKIQVTPYLSVVKGDMFFSRFHTLTVSVNVVGIMGKGLASRAKYQFPDVYVHYQDVCRNKKLRMGNPVLYKRETSLDYQLVDAPQSLSNGNGETWFLLFATKTHWRENSDFNGIEEGMKWLNENYKKEGIKSLALPALGCGLGNLKWQDVVPMLCKYLKNFEIPVQLYLPAERDIAPEYLTKEFLLSKV
ncbi:MAG: DarT ssDNA thymidine ADP-ribosyltransferase family protein [Bacteroidota bacterium]